MMIFVIDHIFQMFKICIISEYEIYQTYNVEYNQGQGTSTINDKVLRRMTLGRHPSTIKVNHPCNCMVRSHPNYGDN